MRARHRHFNARDIGAEIVLDARFISGLSSGSALTTWADRSGNDNDALRISAGGVLFQESAINGLPAVEFQSSALHRMMVDDFIINQNQLTIFSVSLRPADAPGGTDNYPRIYTLSKSGASDFNTTNGLAMTYELVGEIWAYRNLSLMVSLPFTYNQADVLTFSLDEASALLRVNGSEQSGTTSATALDADEVGIGSPVNPALNDSLLNGFISYFSLVKSVLSNPLKKRLEQSASYSFKIAC